MPPALLPRSGVALGKASRRIPRAPLNRSVLRYWMSKRSGERPPGRPDIDPAEMPALLPHVMLVDVTRGPLRFRFRLVGTELCRRYGADYTGRWLDELDLDEHGHAITCDYVDASQLQMVQCDEYAYYMESGRYRHFERLLMPLCRGDEVNMLFGSLHEFTFDARLSPPFYPAYGPDRD